MINVQGKHPALNVSSIFYELYSSFQPFIPLGNELSSLAVKEQPAASRDDEALLNCGRADTCCTPSSEEVTICSNIGLRKITPNITLK